MIWTPELDDEQKSKYLDMTWGMFTPEGNRKVSETFLQVVSWGFDPTDRGDTTERIQSLVCENTPDWIPHEFGEVRDTVVRECIAMRLDELALSRSA